MLADLVHHLRSELTVPQLLRVVTIYSAYLFETAFPFGIQTMCAKLLINLIETVCAKLDRQDALRTLGIVLDRFIDKLQSVERVHVRLKQAWGRKPANSASTSTSGSTSQAATSGGDVKLLKDAPALSTDEQNEVLPRKGWIQIEKAKPIHAVSYASEVNDAYGKGVFQSALVSLSLKAAS